MLQRWKRDKEGKNNVVFKLLVLLILSSAAPATETAVNFLDLDFSSCCMLHPSSMVLSGTLFISSRAIWSSPDFRRGCTLLPSPDPQSSWFWFGRKQSFRLPLELLTLHAQPPPLSYSCLETLLFLLYLSDWILIIIRQRAMAIYL